MSFFSKNEIYLKKTYTVFAAGNEKALESENDAVYEKKDGLYLAKRQNARCFVHSKYSVPCEIESMFALVPRSTEYITLFGCGLGGVVRYALDERNFPDLKRLIIVEPSPAWAQIIMDETDMAETWGQNADKILFFVGYRPDIIGAIIASATLNENKEFFLVYHLSVRTIFAEYYQELFASITDRLRNILISINTSRAMPHIKTYNEILNLARPAYEFSDMMDLFAGKNIIIVSAGPSLKKNIHLLPEAKKKAVVVAVGSAIPILDARGIIPHFRVAIDPFPEQYKLYSNLKDEPVPLLHANALYSEILPGYQGLRFRFRLNNDALGAFLHNKRNLQTVSVPSGMSVANGAAEIFCAAGCRRMVFIGQDMCMYDQRLHADGAKRFFHENTVKKNVLFLKDINGNDVVSPRNYYMIKQYLENTVTRFSDKVEFINATEGGLGIYGVPNEPLAAVLASWEEDDIAPLIAERLQKMELIDFRAELLDFEAKIGKIDSLNDENLRNLQKIKDVFTQDEHLLHRERYVQAFKAAKKNEQELKQIDWYDRFIHGVLEFFLEAECRSWKNNLDNADEKMTFRAILEIQLKTAQATKSFTIILKQALKDAFAAEAKMKTFSIAVK